MVMRSIVQAPRKEKLNLVRPKAYLAGKTVNFFKIPKAAMVCGFFICRNIYATNHFSVGGS